MTVAAFVLGIIGTVLAAASLTWQIVAFLLQGARPKLTPVVGVLSAGGLVSGPAARDVTDSLRRAIEQFPSGPLVIGVKVVNAGRAPFHVAGWAVRSEPSTISFVPGPDDQVGTAEKAQDCYSYREPQTSAVWRVNGCRFCGSAKFVRHAGSSTSLGDAVGTD